MQPELWKKIQDVCDKLSKVTYENLTKIIRLESTGSSTAAKSVEALPAEEIAGDPLELYRLEEEQKAPNVPGFKK